MSETPGAPEHYTPPLVPEPPSISDAAAQWDRAQADGSQPNEYAPHYTAAQQYSPAPGQVYAPPPSPSNRQGLAITSLVLGLIALFTGWIPVWGLVVGALAIVLGAVAVSKKQPKGLAIPGMLMGAIAALTSIVVLVFLIMNSTVSPGSIDTSFDFSIGDPQATLGPESVDGGLAVTEQAFAPSSWDDTTTWFVVVLHNPSPNAYDFAEVTINALDASGAQVDTSFSFPSLPPGDSVVAGTFYELNGAQVASLEVVGPTADSLQGEPGAALEVSDVTVTDDDFFTTARGTVNSPSADLKNGATITVVARDQSGTISGYASGFIDSLAKGQSGAFEATFFEVMPAGTTYQAYAAAF